MRVWARGLVGGLGEGRKRLFRSAFLALRFRVFWLYPFGVILVKEGIIGENIPYCPLLERANPFGVRARQLKSRLL